MRSAESGAIFSTMTYLQTSEINHVYFVACGVSRLARYNVTAETLSEGEVL